jgi:hypothetical protein
LYDCLEWRFGRHPEQSDTESCVQVDYASGGLMVSATGHPMHAEARGSDGGGSHLSLQVS